MSNKLKCMKSKGLKNPKKGLSNDNSKSIKGVNYLIDFNQTVQRVETRRTFSEYLIQCGKETMVKFLNVILTNLDSPKQIDSYDMEKVCEAVKYLKSKVVKYKDLIDWENDSKELREMMETYLFPIFNEGLRTINLNGFVELSNNIVGLFLDIDKRPYSFDLWKGIAERYTDMEIQINSFTNEGVDRIRLSGINLIKNVNGSIEYNRVYTDNGGVLSRGYSQRDLYLLGNKTNIYGIKGMIETTVVQTEDFFNNVV